jgi:hypothetical protein
MDLNLAEHLISVSDELLARYRSSAGYGHSGGRGDIRETILLDWLRQFLPAKVALTKGEVVDSQGVRSREFDIIIHLPSSAPRLFASVNRAVVPVEEVLGLVEIKSHLDAKHLDEFSTGLGQVGMMVRHFQPSAVLTGLSAAAGDPVTDFSVSAADAHRGIGPITGVLFAFEAASTDTVSAYFQERGLAPTFLAAYVLQRSLWLSQGDGSWSASPDSRESFILFAAMMLGLAQDESDRWTFTRPNAGKYMDAAARAADAIRAGRKTTD